MNSPSYLRLISSIVWFLAVAPLLSPVPIVAQSKGQHAASKATLYLHATLIDPDRGAVHPDSSLMVRGGFLQAVEASERNNPDVSIVDLHGKFILPGLINTHVHLAVGQPDPVLARAYLKRELYSGITTVRDMADDLRMLAELKREAIFDEIESPDIYYAALMAGPSFFSDPRSGNASRGYAPGTAPWMRAVDANSDLRQIIAEARGTGATAIKIYADLAPALVSALTDEAHRQGLLVWAHAAVFPAAPLDVIKSGVDVVSHSVLLAYQLASPVPSNFAAMSELNEHWDFDGPIMQTIYQEMKNRGTILDATVDLSYRYPFKLFPPTVGSAVTAAAHRHGVLISAGTDDDPEWGDPDSALVAELIRLAEITGFTPMEALKAGTSVAARTVGQQNSAGKLDKGYVADFVVLDRDPLTSIQNLHSVALVVKHGIMYWRKDYKPFKPNSPTSAGPNQ